MARTWEGGGRATNRYKLRLDKLVKPGMAILHAGCGWDRNQISYRYSEACRVVGVDPDPRVANLYHSDFHCGYLEKMPFNDNCFDIIFCEYVFEHVADPESAFREMTRVLKRGGKMLILTPNLFSYKSLAAAATPHSFHTAMGRHRYGDEFEDHDMYPTYYRCNTKEKIKFYAK